MKIRSVKYNFIMNSILTISSFIFPLITFPYVSRVLFAEGMGKISFASSVVNYFSLISSLGIPTYGIRACARVRKDKDLLSKTVHELLIIHCITTIVSFFFLFLSVVTIKEFQKEKELILINGVSMILNVFGVNWLYSALEQYEYITVRSIIFKLVSIIFIFAFINNKNDYILYGAISIFATAGSNVLNFIYLKKFIYIKKIYKYNFLIHMKPIIIFFAQSLALSMYTNLDTVMVGFIKGDIEVGYYSTAIKMRGILLTLVNALSTVLLPRLSFYVKEKMIQEYNNMIKKSIEFVLLLSVPIVFYLLIFSKETILLLSGRDFINATSTMKIITPTILICGLSTQLGTLVFTALSKEKFVLYAMVIGSITDFILNYLLIPIYGSAGAAFATLITEFIILVFLIYKAFKLISTIFIKLKIDFFKILFSSLVSIFIIIAPINYVNNTFVLLLLTSVSYFSSYVFLLILLRETYIYNFVVGIIRKLKFI